MVHKHQNHTQRLEHQIVQDDALFKCRLLLFEDPLHSIGARGGANC